MSGIGWKPTEQVLVASALVAFFSLLFEAWKIRKVRKIREKWVEPEVFLPANPVPTAFVKTNAAQIREVLARERSLSLERTIIRPRKKNMNEQEMQLELARLRAENERMKASRPGRKRKDGRKPGDFIFSVSDGGQFVFEKVGGTLPNGEKVAVVSGTFYPEHIRELLVRKEEILEFLEENKADLLSREESLKINPSTRRRKAAG